MHRGIDVRLRACAGWERTGQLLVGTEAGMLQNHLSAALLDEVEAALSALPTEEERALRLRFRLSGFACDWITDEDSSVVPTVRQELEARALTLLRTGAVSGDAAAARRGRGTGCGPQGNGGSTTTQRPAGGGTEGPADERSRRSEPPEPTPYDVTGWDEA